MDNDIEYQQTLDYIYSFIDNSLTHQKDPKIAIVDLSRMNALMVKLGNPYESYPKIHIAGSKGKGSVSAFCASALQSQGYKVGLYTSPHLKDFEERIQINRTNISRDELINLVVELKPTFELIPGLNTFEITTALAFVYFKRKGVDIAVIEVGLGGRLDSTNVIKPIISIITAIYLEHTKILGDTLQQIATEKGGIIKRGVPVILGPQREEPKQTILKIAAEKSAPLVQIGKDYTFYRRSTTLEKQMIEICSSINGKTTELEIGLLGKHQVENAAIAFGALKRLDEEGIHISEKAIKEGFSNVFWPGRFEILNLNPPVVVDSAHNPDSVRMARKSVEEYFPNRSKVVIIGVSDDKDIPGMVREILPGTVQIICSQSTHPRAMDAERIKDLIEKFEVPVRVVVPIKEALKIAIENSQKDCVVLVIGSIFVAATARIAWFEEKKKEQEVQKP